MLRIVLISLASLSGSIALSHELLWTRRLVDLLGATEWVTGRVLGIFFLGLSLGGWLATRWTEAKGLAIKRLAIAEFAIAVFALPAIFLPLWADQVFSILGPEQLGTVFGHSVKLFLSVVVVMPPAIAMGTTMPLFIRATTDFGGSVKQTGIWIYTLNMVGGVFGLWLTSTQLLDQFGVQGTMWIATAGNVIVALGALTLAKTAPAEDPDEIAPDSEIESSDEMVPKGLLTNTQILVLAFLSGLFVLALEILLLRLLSLVAPSSLQTTSAMLANVILFLSLGSAAVALLNRFSVPSKTLLTIGLAGATAFCVFCPVVLYLWTNKLINIRYLVAREGDTIDSLGSYWVILFSTVAVVSGGALICSGLVFPSILSIHSKRDPQGKTFGRVLAFNGIGGLVGSELANSFLISQFGIYGGFAVLTIAFSILVFMVWALVQRTAFTFGLVLVMGFVVALGLMQYHQLRYISPKSKKKYFVEETEFGPEGVLLVVDDETDSRSILANNQYILGSSGAATMQRRQLLVPWLLHPKAEKVCSLGLATGISVGGLETLNNPPQITAVELSKRVADLARKYFSKENRAFYERAGNSIVIEDARTFTAVSEDDFDIIVADLFRPHGAGEGRLFSVEHFQNVKRALRKDGLYCHWLPAHQLGEEQFWTIAATFQHVFPETLVVMGNEVSRTPTIGFCGWKDDRKWETEDLVQKIRAVRAEKNLSDTLVLNAQLLIAGVLKKDAVASIPINTLDNASLELSAGRFWILKDLRRSRPADTLENGFLFGKNWKDFLGKLYQKTDPILDPRHRTEFLQRLK